jgi:hypothetical protein
MRKSDENKQPGRADQDVPADESIEEAIQRHAARHAGPDDGRPVKPSTDEPDGEPSP